MPSKLSKLLLKTTGTRLALWYSAVFIASSLLLFVLIYFPLRTAILDKDHNIIMNRLQEYALQIRQRGFAGMLAEIRLEEIANLQGGFFVRVADQTGRTVIATVPVSWRNLDFARLPLPETTGGREVWHELGGDGEEPVLEVASLRLADGFILQVGKSSEERQHLLAYYRKVFAGTLLPVIILGFGGGFFLAHRSLRPIRDLLQALRSIRGTGSLEARVPLIQTGDELDELIRLFNGMLEKIEQLLTGMRSSLDNVAHDLRTPVTRLRAGIETALQSKSDADSLREALMDCAEESERIVTMLNTLMDISEAETGVMRLRRETLAIAPLLEEVIDLYQYVAEEKGVVVSVAAPQELMVTADANRLRQVVANLLDNAIKYTPSGGTVSITADRAGTELRLVVADTGCGIAPQDQTRIFDRLFRADTSRSLRGLGLGLSLVKAVIHAHNGRIQVESRLEHGSRFIVTLPAISPA